MRDLGTVGLADGEELGALLEAFQSTMIIDNAALVAAAPPAPRPADINDDEAVYIGYVGCRFRASTE
jgi:hypothetical protein